MKKFVNDPRQFVPEMLKGIALANPETLRYVPEYNLIMRADAPNPGKVSVIQGSGSGHEPAHVMVVGKGMLDAACPGDVFSAPPMDYVFETSKLLASPKGVLHLVNNYTGDRMAFEMGQEMAEAEGITIGTLIVDDDVAVKDSTYTVGRRGVAGNFFVIKAVGAAAEQDADLDELLRIGNKVNANPRTHQITKVDHGWTVSSSAKYVYQGSTNTGTFGKPDNKPVTSGYRCTASTLSWITKGKVTDVESRVSNRP
jgi:dihydroxyacetone kinase-like protein